jgi:hypothetical protein
MNDRINQGEEKAVSPTEPKPASPTGARSGDLSNQSLQQAGTAKHNTDGVDAVISNPGAPTSPDVKTVQLAIPPTSVAPPAETRQNLVGISSQPGSSAQAEGNTETKPHADSTGIEDVRAGSHAETVQAEATRAEAPRGDIPAQMLAKTAAVRSSGPGTTTAGTKPDFWTKEPTTLRGWIARVMRSNVFRLYKAEQDGKTTKPSTTADTDCRKCKEESLEGVVVRVVDASKEKKHGIEHHDETTRPSTAGHDQSEADRGSPSANIPKPSNPNPTGDISDRTAMYDQLLPVARHVTAPAAKCKSNFVAKYFFPCLSDGLNQPGKWTEDEEEEVVKWVAKGLTLMEKGGYT